MGYSVGQVARLAGVTVRTLHHYDEIGLMSPGQRTASGYRRYTDADLERLQHVLFYRELGFPLEEIAVILDEPGSDTLTHLKRQHELLNRRIGRLREMAAAVERAMEANTMGISLTPEERFEIFGDFRPEEHEAEAEERWGGTEAFEQSRRRMGKMTKDDWARFAAEAARTTEAFAEAFTGGLPADGERAMELAEEHRAHITRWCYDCTYEIHRGLGDMYVADARFAANYEPHAAGLTQYIRDAIHANADRAES
ncbi:MerR family transcriptional regulator [Planomonospora venezuelensis]|uniref:DNA-binding transcriptional MerR regulator n=1 Tax=Planomonospora venezuelensis TaxID=1999 RepID=A0A841DBP4_PLAVE|nr:MerR family transcriptional regulator [Planomonospora venezuelensis]MBB5968072.1 DNA-binding transcriptional MerR regulator [Planomonospora venezuelensis]GIN04874.1 HTH-type transcriptional activator TipA [Planomonospora venezuelensis]